MNNQKIFAALLTMIILIVVSHKGNAQTEASTQTSDDKYTAYSLSTILTLDNPNFDFMKSAPLHALDSTEMAKPKIKLLPDHLGNMEKIFWSENGIFRTTGIASLTPPERKIELSVRRTMLNVHQIGGFTTLALFIPTLILGQRNINMRNAVAEGKGTFDRNLSNTHQLLGDLTFGAYMATALLALFSPPPLIRRDEWSTVSLHKTLAIIHFTGMVAIPILAVLAAHEERIDFTKAQSLQRAHQIVAYTTFAAFTASMIVITF